MHARTKELDELMKARNLTARQVGEIVGREAHTVRVWRCRNVSRVIPENTLELLKLKLATEAASND